MPNPRDLWGSLRAKEAEKLHPLCRQRNVLFCYLSQLSQSAVQAIGLYGREDVAGDHQLCKRSGRKEATLPFIVSAHYEHLNTCYFASIGLANNREYHAAFNHDPLQSCLPFRNRTRAKHQSSQNMEGVPELASIELERPFRNRQPAIAQKLTADA